ncbi:PAS domain-containing protein [Hymenobacter persicinus]|uniref:histidine kinase n=1 Tax=Hymenobacter persicinus TaxID=2025506 RepID=A0A4Q5L7V4_9BACT|nr:PAS domain-containing protein [Hymenobacter persicinus]RYU76725.1 PAS domain S-box protein [Hymenobacter persicinus]
MLPTFPPAALAQTLFNVSLTGIILFRPVYESRGETREIIDLAYVQLNPAAQRMLQLPEQPTDSFLTLYPHAANMGVFAFYRDTYLSGAPGRYNVNYQYDGLDNYFHLAAEPSGDLLVVSFTDTSDHDRTAAELALRESQRREQAARAAAEQERNLLQAILTQAPVAMALFEGDEQVVVLANPQICAMWDYAPAEILGRPLLQSVPELRGQGFTEKIADVAHTGVPFVGTEVAANLRQGGRVQTCYFNFVYQPLYDPAGRLLGVLDIAIDVTAQVLSRQRVQELNGELRAANDELVASNAELSRTQRQLQQLNQELEDRVRERTRQLELALNEAQQHREQLREQQGRLQQILGQVPASIATLHGPDHHYSFFNDSYLALTGHRARLGQTVAEVLPEVREQGFVDLLDQVYATGEPFAGTERLLQLHNPRTGQTEARYVDFIYQPLPGNAGQNQGILAFIVDVTEKVRAHQALEELRLQVLAAAEQKVQEREAFYQIFAHTPAAICIQRGPEHRYEYLNAAYQALFSGRQLLGRPVAEALPDAVQTGLAARLDEVYRTGNTYFGHEERLWLLQAAGQAPQERYFTFTYQAYRENEQVVGVSTFAFDVTEQVAAQRATEASARQLKLITDALPVLISYLDQSQTYRFANEAYQHWFHQSPAELLGRTAREVVGESAYQNVQPYIERALAGERIDFEARMPYRENFVKHIRTSYIPDVREGRVLGFYSMAADVTEQVEAQREADRQRQLLHTLFMQAPAPIVILDGPELTYQLVNPAYQQIFPGRELLGKPLLTALPELEGTLIPTLLREVYETGETRVAQELPLLMARYEGQALEEIHWTFTIQPRYGAHGAVDGVLTFAHEVTDQVRARRAVEESEQHFRRLADSVPAMLWVTDAQGQCTYLNAQWYAYTEQQQAEALGIGWVDAVHPDDAPAAAQAFFDANARQTPFYSLYRLRRQDGVYRWTIDSGLPLFTATGEFEGFVGTVIDVHEQRLAEQALQRLTRKLRNARDAAQTLNTELQDTNRQLTRTNVDLDNFIYTASHDLKAPITNIEGLLHVLREQIGSAAAPAAEPVLAMMYEAVSRFQRTITQLSDVTKLQKEQGQPTTAVALAPVLNDVRLDLLPLLLETGARLDVDVEACPTVLFSVKNLRSVLYNLLSNAIKYRHPARVPHVQVRCRAETGYSVLSVQDNGLGLLPEQLTELFEMFRRLHSHVEGSGLGLYMVKRSVENAGGKVVVSSEIGVGSTFSVYFLR